MTAGAGAGETWIQYLKPDGTPSEFMALENAALLVGSGHIAAKTLVWCEGLDTWTPFQRCRDQVGLPEWKEMTAEDGSTYFYNSCMGATSWDRPPDAEPVSDSELDAAATFSGDVVHIAKADGSGNMVVPRVNLQGMLDAGMLRETTEVWLEDRQEWTQVGALGIRRTRIEQTPEQLRLAAAARKEKEAMSRHKEGSLLWLSNHGYDDGTAASILRGVTLAGFPPEEWLETLEGMQGQALDDLADEMLAAGEEKDSDDEDDDDEDYDDDAADLQDQAAKGGTQDTEDTGEEDDDDDDDDDERRSRCCC